MATSAASKNVGTVRGKGGIVGAIVPPKKPVDHFPLMTYLANNCNFLDDDGGSSLDEEVLKADSDRRVEELLNEAALSMKDQCHETNPDEDSERKKAMELIHSMELSRNQTDTWKVVKPQSKKGPDFKGFLHPLHRRSKEDDYFSGTRKVKQPKERKRCRSDEVVLMDGKLVLKNASSNGELYEVAQSPIKFNPPPRPKSPRVPSVGLPFTPGPPPSFANNAWMQRSGSALFSEVRSNTLVAYGVACSEEEDLAKAIAESLRTAKEEKQRYIDMRSLYEPVSLPFPRKDNQVLVRCPPDPPGTMWEDDDVASGGVTQSAQTRQISSISSKEMHPDMGRTNFYPSFDRTSFDQDANLKSSDKSDCRLGQRYKYSRTDMKSSKSPSPPPPPPPPPVSSCSVSETSSDSKSVAQEADIQEGDKLLKSSPRLSYQNSDGGCSRNSRELTEVNSSSTFPQFSEPVSLEDQVNIRSKSMQQELCQEKRTLKKTTHVSETFCDVPSILKQHRINEPSLDNPVRQNVPEKSHNQDVKEPTIIPVLKDLHQISPVRIKHDIDAWRNADDMIQDLNSGDAVKSCDQDQKEGYDCHLTRQPPSTTDNEMKECVHGSLLEDRPSRLPTSAPSLTAAMKTFSQLRNPGVIAPASRELPRDRSVDKYHNKAKDSNEGSGNLHQAEPIHVPTQNETKISAQIGRQDSLVYKETQSGLNLSQFVSGSPLKLQPQEPLGSPSPFNEIPGIAQDLDPSLAASPTQLFQMLLMQHSLRSIPSPVLQTDQNIPGLNFNAPQFNGNNQTGGAAPSNFTSFSTLGNTLPVGTAGQPAGQFGILNTLPNGFSGWPGGQFGMPNSFPTGLPNSGLSNAASVPGFPNLSSGVLGMPNPLSGGLAGLSAPLPGALGLPNAVPGPGHLMGLSSVPQGNLAGMLSFPSTLSGAVPGLLNGYLNGFPSVPSHNNIIPSNLQGQGQMTSTYPLPSGNPYSQQNPVASLQGPPTNVPVGVTNPLQSCNSFNGMESSLPIPGNTPLLCGRGRGRLPKTAPNSS